MSIRITASLLIAVALLTFACQSPQNDGSSRGGSQPSSPPSDSTAQSDPEVVRAPVVQTREALDAMSLPEALELLTQGNARFVAGNSRIRNLPAKVAATAGGQFPFAVILSCLDSRQPVEMIFDQGIGDVFNARVAGNILNSDILGSMEFACKVSGAKLIVVLGHSNCGAIKGAIDKVQLGNLTGLLTRIQPAIAAAPIELRPRDSNNAEFVQRVAEANVRVVMQQIRDHSPVLCEMLDNQQIRLVGGMYDLSTGRVQFYAD
jgi:carbonic anhydrase